MGRTHVGSSYACPAAVIPARGQVAEYGSQSVRKDCCDVFQEQESGSYRVSHAQDFTVETAARVCAHARLLSGAANVLAREARMDAIHASRVVGWIEQPDIAFVHSQAGEPSFFRSLSEDLAGVSVPLNSGNWRMSEDEVGEQSAAGTSKEVEGSHVIASTD